MQSGISMDFANPTMGTVDVLQDFDFDSFLHYDGGDNDGFSFQTSSPIGSREATPLTGNPGMANGQGQGQQPQMQANRANCGFGSFIGSEENLIMQQQQQQAGVLPQDVGQMVTSAGRPQWNGNAAPHALQGLPGQQAGVNGQRPLANPSIKAQQAFIAQQSQAQMLADARAKAQQQIALHGQPGGMGPMPPQQSAMTTFNGPLRTLQRPQQPNPLNALQASFEQPLDPHFAINQRPMLLANEKWEWDDFDLNSFCETYVEPGHEEDAKSDNDRDKHPAPTANELDAPITADALDNFDFNHNNDERDARIYAQRKKRLNSRSIYKRTLSQSIGSDTDDEDLQHVNASETSSSERRLRRRKADGPSLIFDNAPQIILEEDEPQSGDDVARKQGASPNDVINVRKSGLQSLPYYGVDADSTTADSKTGYDAFAAMPVLTNFSRRGKSGLGIFSEEQLTKLWWQAYKKFCETDPYRAEYLYDVLSTELGFEKDSIKVSDTQWSSTTLQLLKSLIPAENLATEFTTARAKQSSATTIVETVSKTLGLESAALAWSCIVCFLKVLPFQCSL